MKNVDYVVTANKIKIYQAENYAQSIDFVKFLHENFHSHVTLAVFITQEKIKIINVNM